MEEEVEDDTVAIWSNEMLTYKELKMRIRLLSHERKGKLSVLRLCGNGLRRLPGKDLLSLSNLDTLDVSDNAITFVPPEVGQLSRLRWLILRNNRLVSLPSALHRCTKLSMLACKPNPLMPSFLNCELQGTVKVRALLNELCTLIRPLEEACYQGKARPGDMYV